MSFQALVNDLHALRQRRAQRRQKPIPRGNQAQMLKALQDTVAQFAGPTRKRPPGETLRRRLDALLEQAAAEFKAGRITGQELTMFESHMNRALDQFRQEGRL